MTDHVDSELAEGLGDEVAAVLEEWAQLHNRYYGYEHWLVNGRSRAPVAVVVETDAHQGKSAMLILKVLTVRSGPVADLEYGRHMRAVKQAPDFARDHLTEFVHEAIPVGRQQWITFQRIAGKTLGSAEVLTVLLRRMLRIKADPEPPGTQDVTCDPPAFAEACARIIGGVLRDWAGDPYLPVAEGQWSVPEFFRRHLGDQVEPGGRLADWSGRYQGTQVQLPEEREPLANPFAMARGEHLAGTLIRPFIGPAHGDLHADNALVQVRPTTDTSRFYLIDTALYEDSGPLTRDPAHFILYIIARSMKAIPHPARGPLIDLLLDPAGGPAGLVPGWLALVIQQVDAEIIRWVLPSGLERKWSAQSDLSMAACAMLFLGRSSTREQDKPWFLRLAARAADRFARAHPGADRLPAGPPGQQAAGTPLRVSWIGWLCREYPDLLQAATQDERGAEAEQFRTDALGGLDRTEEFREFVRQLGGPDPDVRLGTRGSEGQSEPEHYLCPIGLCQRRERRPPGGEVPACHLARDKQRRMQSSLG